MHYSITNWQRATNSHKKSTPLKRNFWHQPFWICTPKKSGIFLKLELATRFFFTRRFETPPVFSFRISTCPSVRWNTQGADSVATRRRPRRWRPAGYKKPWRRRAPIASGVVGWLVWVVPLPSNSGKRWLGIPRSKQMQCHPGGDYWEDHPS